jgi:capsule polysaccharide modification protein KpsS
MFTSQYHRHAVELQRYKGIDILAIPHWIETHWRDIPAPIEAARAAEAKYNLISFRQVYNGDRELFECSEGECINRALHYFEAWEAIFDANSVDAVVSAIGGELIRTTSFFAARRRGIRTLYLNFFPLPHRFVIVTTLDGDFLNLDLTSLPDLSPAQDLEAQTLVEQLIDKPPRFFRWQPPTLRAEYVGKVFSRLYFALFTDRYAYPSRWIFRKSRYILRRVFNYFLSRNLYERPQLGSKFLFFPLHDSEDFQLRVRAPHCQNQEFIIQLIAQSLPIGYKLYVKEHPNFLGGIDTSMLRRIKRIPNVTLVSPSVSALELISAAEAIVTINSTVGFEALVRGKPVVTLGPSFYRGKGITIDVDHFYDLPQAIKLAIDGKPDKDLVRKFLYYAVRKARPGNYTLHDFSEKNIRQVAHAILEELGHV